MTLRVLVVGDPYMPVSAYASALAGLDGRVELTTMQIAEVTCAPPVTESERGLREYVGDPAEVARAVAGHDVLVVHGAPVSAEVLAKLFEGIAQTARSSRRKPKPRASSPAPSSATRVRTTRCPPCGIASIALASTLLIACSNRTRSPRGKPPPHRRNRAASTASWCRPAADNARPAAG